MPLLTFIFGPNNTFFFDSPKSWKFHNIPPTLRQLFNASMNPGWRIQQPYCLALGPPNNSPEPIWYIGCKVCDGNDKIFYSQNFFDTNYPDLSVWIKTIPNSPKSCFVTFGPGLSYFGCAPGYGSIWAGIPSELKEKVQKAFDTPNLVSLGMKNAWFVMWPDGYYSWKFYGNYESLHKILAAAEPRSVEYLAISPYHKSQYFIVFKNQEVKYNLSEEWMPQIREVFSEWQVEFTQKQLPPLPPSQHMHSVAGPYPPQFQPKFQPEFQSQHPQWNPNYSLTPSSPQYLSPISLPATPASFYSTPASPALSRQGYTGNSRQPSPMSANATLAPIGIPTVIPRQPSSASTGTLERRKLWKRMSSVVSRDDAPVAPRDPVRADEGSQQCTPM